MILSFVYFIFWALLIYVAHLVLHSWLVTGFATIVALAFIFSWLRVRIVFRDNIEIRTVDIKTAPLQSMTQMKNSEQLLNALGFEHVGDYFFQSMPGVNLVRAFIDKKHQTYGLMEVVVVEGRKGEPATERLYFSFDTPFSDGSLLTTTNSPYSGCISYPPNFKLQILPADVVLAELYEVHLHTVKELSSSENKQPQTLSSETFLDYIDKNVAAQVAHRRSIGYLTPVEFFRMLFKRPFRRYIYRKAAS